MIQTFPVIKLSRIVIFSKLLTRVMCHLKSRITFILKASTGTEFLDKFIQFLLIADE